MNFLHIKTDTHLLFAHYQNNGLECSCSDVTTVTKWKFEVSRVQLMGSILVPIDMHHFESLASCGFCMCECLYV